MRKVIMENEATDTINLSNVGNRVPIFAKKNGLLKGMIVEDIGKGWILRIGGVNGHSGHHNTRYDCMQKASEYGYSFFVEDLPCTLTET